MNDLVIFAIGLAVFFVTVYGVVLAGGFRFMRRQLRKNPELADELDDEPINHALLGDSVTSSTDR